MTIKKPEFYSPLWRSCYELRSGMGPYRYKNYVLPLLFVKYMFDKYVEREHALVLEFTKT